MRSIPAQRDGPRTTDRLISPPIHTQALTTYDFGTLFKTDRAQAGLTQTALGDLVELDQPRVSSIERGEHRLRDIATSCRA